MNKKGFLLLELVITMGLIFLTLPFLFSTFLTSQKYQNQFCQTILQNDEFNYAEHLLRQDLAQCISFDQVANNNIIGRTPSQDILQYTCAQNTLNRTIQRTGLNKQTTRINKQIKIQKMEIITKSPKLITVNFFTSIGTKPITIYLVNEI